MAFTLNPGDVSAHADFVLPKFLSAHIPLCHAWGHWIAVEIHFIFKGIVSTNITSDYETHSNVLP